MPNRTQGTIGLFLKQPLDERTIDSFAPRVVLLVKVLSWGR